MAACPPLEDIAAFIDGALSPEERARITEHLARCESCYEVFSGAVHFLEDEKEEGEEEKEASSAEDTGGRGVLPFPLAQEKNQETKIRVEPARLPRRASRWLPLAAAVVLATGLGYMMWQSSRVLPEVTAAELAEPLQGQRRIIKYLYQPEDVPRGGGDEEPIALTFQAPAFFAGVYIIDLRLSVGPGKVEDVQEILRSLSTELDQVPFSHPEAANLRKVADEMTDSASLGRFASTIPEREKAFQNWFAEDPFFRFGLWTEAGRLSAVARSPKFFEQRRNRRFLSAIPREISSVNDERYTPILTDLQQIEPLWDRDKRTKEDYDALALHFGNIIDQFERIQKEDQDPGYPDS